MVKAVGFRNLIVHEYWKIELEQAYEIAQNDINDLNEYLKAIFKKLGLADWVLYRQEKFNWEAARLFILNQSIYPVKCFAETS